MIDPRAGMEAGHGCFSWAGLDRKNGMCQVDPDVWTRTDLQEQAESGQDFYGRDEQGKIGSDKAEADKNDVKLAGTAGSGVMRTTFISPSRDGMATIRFCGVGVRSASNRRHAVNASSSSGCAAELQLRVVSAREEGDSDDVSDPGLSKSTTYAPSKQGQERQERRKMDTLAAQLPGDLLAVLDAEGVDTTFGLRFEFFDASKPAREDSF
ncbi:hypothetical protein B0H19DRAFT_1082508 [Mycena capillaripes]|nr:hypothetical protein B0H19DRAFT_1082508 [Mycena capillaripes]